MKVTALNAIRHNGEDFAPGEVLDVSKNDAAHLLACGAIGSQGVEKTVEIDGEALFNDTVDFGTLKVPELKAVCQFLKLPHTGNKDELVSAVVASMGTEEETVDLDSLDKEGLLALAKEEGIELDPELSEEAMRDALEEAE